MPASTPPFPSTQPRAWFGRWCWVPAYRIETLAPATTMTGPTIFEAETTTVIAGDGDTVSINQMDGLISR
ncbi:hypothetical protein [Methylobacterium oryzisoli]